MFKYWESEFYDKYAIDERTDSEDFRSIAIGFFIAKGLNLDEAYETYEYCIKKQKF